MVNFVYRNGYDIRGVSSKFITSWLEDIYIKEAFRGTGIGSQFLEFIGNMYPEAVLRLEVEEENGRAVKVYEKNGFNVLPYMEMKKLL